MELVEVVEGAAKLLVPGGGRDRGPGRREAPVFFNPAMALSRDVSLAVYSSALEPGSRVLDGLAASGARAVRIALATDHAVAANDWNPVAANLCAENAKRNGVEVEVIRRNLGALLWETSWDAIDVDPFGSPSPFVDAACRALKRRSLLALTATDTTALFGVYPAVAERRYMATPLRSEVGHEIALRILAGFAARQAAKHDAGLNPLIAHATDHYYRVYLEARGGAARADAALDAIGVLWLCAQCGGRGLARLPPDECPECGFLGLRAAGPLWAGPLLDAEACTKARDAASGMAAARPEALAALLGTLADEARVPGLYFDLHVAAGRAGADVPRTEAVLERLRAAGRNATRTSMRPTAIRTDATMREVRETIEALGLRS